MEIHKEQKKITVVCGEISRTDFFRKILKVCGRLQIVEKKVAVQPIISVFTYLFFTKHLGISNCCWFEFRTRMSITRTCTTTFNFTYNACIFSKFTPTNCIDILKFQQFGMIAFTCCFTANATRFFILCTTKYIHNF